MIKVLLLSVLTLNLYAAQKYNYFFEIKKSKQSSAEKMFKNYGLKLTKNSWRLKLTDKMAESLFKTGLFEYLEKETISKLDIDDSAAIEKAVTNRNWHMEKLKVAKAWKTTTGKKDIVVAVCDSGVDATRPEFKNKILKGWNFIDGNEDTSPNTNHGTAVAGFVAASFTEGYASTGSAPGIKILPGKIVTTRGSVPTSAMLGCIRWAADKGAKVINVSMTGVNSSSSASAARYAYNKGALVVWAAGNANRTRSWKDRKEILAVGGTNRNNRRYRASWRYGSQRGHFVDVVAPGQSVNFMRINGGYGTGNGTSYSAPMVSGVAALIYSVKPSLTPEQVTYIIKSTARNLGKKKSFGSGLVDAYAAIELAKKY